MNYQKIYNSLIEKAQNRVLEGYSEKHHIVPKCMGGNDDGHNLVDLTAEEHYLAHQLLVRLYPGNKKLVFAATMMTRDSNGNRSNNKLYGWIRRHLANAISEKNKGNPGRPLPCTEETKAKISKANKGKVRSEKAKERYSSAKKGIPKTAEAIQKRTETRKRNREEKLKNQLLFE